MAKKTQDSRVFMQNAVKTLATNIRFASVDKPVRSIVVTSSIPNEGKTTIATNLAQALASGGKTVLIVECDMRCRSLATALGTHARNGIYSVLSGQVELDDAVVRTSTRNVWFLDSEPHIPNPVDIPGSKRFRSFIERLKDEYDYVVLEAPPLSAFIDAAVIGSIADGTLLVVRRNFVRCEEVLSPYEQLKKAGGQRPGHRLQLLRGQEVRVLLRVLLIALTLAFSYFLVRFSMRLLPDKVDRALGFVSGSAGKSA